MRRPAPRPGTECTHATPVAVRPPSGHTGAPHRWPKTGKTRMGDPGLSTWECPPMGDRVAGFPSSGTWGVFSLRYVLVKVCTWTGDLTSRTNRYLLSSREMDVRQLSTLVAIADHGTFSAAARALYTVQSNVSSHIARLEKELGVILVDRAQGGLTDDGARVVERARRILNEIDDITADMSSRHEDVSGQTRLGVIGTTARWLIPPFLARLGDEHPNVRVIVQEGATSSIVPNVLSGQLNGAIVHLPVDDPELTIEPLFAEDLLLLAADGHPLADRDEIPLADLHEVPLLLPPPGAALRRVLERAAASTGITLRAQAEVDGVRLLASLAFDGFGAAIVPATAVPTWLQGTFRRITVPELPRRVVAFARRRRPTATAPTTAALETLRSVARDEGERQHGVHLDAAAIPVTRSS